MTATGVKVLRLFTGKFPETDLHLLFLEGFHEQVAGNHQKHFNAEVAVGEMFRIEVERMIRIIARPLSEVICFILIRIADK